MAITDGNTTTSTGHKLFTPAQAASVAANLAAEDSSLAALVSRNFANDLLGGGKAGAPIEIKIPTTLIARSRDIDDITNNIVLDTLTEKSTTLNLDRVHDYSAVALSEADMTLNLQDYSAQVLQPQASAVVHSLEHKVRTKLLAVAITDLSAEGVTYDPANPVPYFTAIRKKLRQNGVAQNGIQMVVGTEVYANLLDAEAITDASQSGSTAALREAGVGKVRGFNVVESTEVPDTEILAFHRDAVTLATRAPVVPQGASFAATVNERGYSLRYIRDYVADKTVDRSLLSTFSGVAILPTFKVTRNYAATYDGDGGTGAVNPGAVSIEEIPNGGILHLDTAADEAPVV